MNLIYFLNNLLKKPFIMQPSPYDDVAVPAEYMGLNAKYAGADPMHTHFPLMKILKGFLLFDENMYITNPDQNALDASVDFLKTVHQFLGTMPANHLRDRQKVEVLGYCEAYHDRTGGYLSYLEYRVSMTDQFNRVVKFDCLSLLMGKIDLEETSKGNILTLMFGMTGFTIMPNDREPQQHIVPVDVFCRSGENTLIAPSNAETLIGAMAYANQAFIQIAGGLEFDPSANETWFEDRRFMDANRICEQLDSRTMSSLSGDILSYRQLTGLNPL